MNLAYSAIWLTLWAFIAIAAMEHQKHRQGQTTFAQTAIAFDTIAETLGRWGTRMTTAAQTFSDYTDTWFDSLAAAQPNGATWMRLDYVCKTKATRANLDKLRQIADTLAARESIPLVAHIDAVIAGTFAAEFRYTYTQFWRDVSATGELFSMVRQAINYPRD